MERGYWLPPGSERLAACDGFYIRSKAVYQCGDTERDWDAFLDGLIHCLTQREQSFRECRAWKQRRYVVVQNRHVQVIAEDVDDYVAVYVLIPEDCPAVHYAGRAFPRYLSLLRQILVGLYPGDVFQRINSQHIKAVI